MSPLPSGLPEEVGDGESLGRFCGSSSWFARETKRVKYPAFLPAPDNDTSVYRVTGMSPAEIWEHAERYFVDREGAPYQHHGAALVGARHVRAADIEVFAHEDPPRHANLRGWPVHDDPVLQKSRRKEAATKIADKATFFGKE
jgi:hypothetical protein